MQARRRQTEDRVARFCRLAGQYPAAFDGADGEAGQIVLAWFIEPRHFRRFAANQRATGLAAAFGDAGDQVAPGLDVELSGG